MNYHSAFGQALASLSYSGRCPSRKEYFDGAPAEKRAIRARWQEIVRTERETNYEAWKEAVMSLDYTKPPLLLIDSKNPCDRDEGEFSAQERFYRGMPAGPDNSDDHGA